MRTSHGRPSRPRRRPDADHGAPAPDDDAATPPDRHTAPAVDGVLDDRIYAAVRQKILVGEYLAGERLNEIDLAEALGVSRTPVREALARLAQYGLVRTVPRRGTVVRRLTRSEVVDLLDLREALECLAVRLAAARLGPTELAAIRAQLRECAAEAAQDLPRGGAALDAPDLHAMLVRASHNALLIEFMERVYDLLLTLRIGSTRVAGRGKRAVDEHWQILEALEAGDAAVAEQRLRLHLQHSRANILDHLPWPDAQAR
jgi:DNA-binding GntR family transcriptional regulator